MDVIHRFTRRAFTRNVVSAVAISLLVIAGAAMLGRGILRIEGSVLEAAEPTELTVARLIEEYDLFPSEVYILPRREDGEWRYSITMRNGDVYFIRIAKDGPPWALAAKPEKLRERE